MSNTKGVQVDTWVWGRERILWGFEPSHKYTFKILEPKRGRAGCMSLQYHLEKSESWLVLRGELWTLFVVDGKVCTRIMRAGDGQNILTGMIHRMAGVTDDVQVAEPSTPDRHAADKSVLKDVVRLHCVHGRPCDAPRDSVEAALLQESIRISEEAMVAIDAGQRPREYNPEFLLGRGSFRITE
ncbi:MAG: hypothetical protein EBZ48_04135 [Proteobacteria bacterium]|nr:hypothetical protein [Pseudomonadota bacterium]